MNKVGDDIPGRIIHSMALSFPFILIIYSLGCITTDGLYGYIYPPGWDRAIIHSASLLSLSTSFLVIYLMMGYLYPLLRAIVTLTLTVFSIHFYDLVWSFSSWSERGYGFSFLALLTVVIVLVLLERMDNKHGFIEITRSGSILCSMILIIIIFAFGMMAFGFWDAMSLYDVGMGPDPNIGNIWWLISKVVTFWLPVSVIERRDYKVPLKLDPRVLIW